MVVPFWAYPICEGYFVGYGAGIYFLLFFADI
jgi:hypothetical protein